jgi:endonuclease/exonuclease/phosphatase family metal-dependent hydrolase
MNVQNQVLIPLICSALCIGFLAGCDERSNPLAETEVPEMQLSEIPGMALGQKPLTVMSRNVYFGGDIGPVLAVGFSDLELLSSVAAGVWAEVQANDFHERAVALVDEIEEARPDVVGLQELAEFLTFELNLADGSFGVTGAVDFQSILEEELRSRRLPYSFVAVQKNTTVRVPVAGADFGGGFVPTHLVQLTIRDAVLVRQSLNVRDVSQGNYQAVMSLGLDPFGNPVEMKRGWIRVDAKVNGVPYHFVSTHMEIQAFSPIQLLQAQELLTEIAANLDGVTVLMGDFNSDAAASFGDPTWTPTYQQVRAAGFDDAWALANPGETSRGLTCCNASDLRNPEPELTQRIDFVFLRASELKQGDGIYPGFVDVQIVGDDPAGRTNPSGLWPSDHAGLVANLGLDRGRFKKLK